MLVVTVVLLWPSVALADGIPPGARVAAPDHEFQPTPLAVAEAPAKSIEVDLSEQRLTAWEGARPVRSLVVSTGDDAHPTVRGRFKIKEKYDKIDMIGRDYYYRDVPYVMMYARPFYVHAAPWRAQFGVPASRGCVTLSTADAAWLYDWAPVGTAVVIHW